jgi:elongation factor P
MPTFGDVRRGTVIKLENDLYLVTKTEFRNPGNWRAILHLTVKNLRSGTLSDQRVRPQDKVETVFVDQRQAQYLYSDSTHHHFMYTDTYEQEAFADDVLGEDALYLVPEVMVQVELYDGKPISVQLPAIVKQTISYTEPALKGATAQAQYKAATTDTGLNIKVPGFVEIGDVIEIDTRTGEYLGRANK